MSLNTFATLNVAGLAKKKKRVLLDQLCHEKNISLCALQESNLHESRYDLPFGHIIASPPASHQAGLGFWISNCFSISDISIIDVVKDIIQELTFYIGNKLVVCYNMHLPHKDSQTAFVLTQWVQRLSHWGIMVPQFKKVSGVEGTKVPDIYDSINSKLEDSVDRTIPSYQGPMPTFIVLGDLNMELERSGEVSSQWKKVSVRIEMQSVFSALSMTHLPFSLVSPPASGTRGTSFLDYICLPKSWHLRVHSMEVTPFSGSDHSLVLARVLLDDINFKPPYWRFKNDLLGQLDFVSSMCKFLESKTTLVPEESVAFVDWWESLKTEIIQVSRVCWERIKKKKSFSQSPRKTSTSSNSTNFCPPPHIHFIKDETGEIISDQHTILNKLADFYEKLYSSSREILIPPDNMTFGLDALSQEYIDDLALPFTVDEFWRAATSLNLAKAPGGDGLTLEFYLKFWSVLGPLVLSWFKHTCTLGGLSGSAGLAVITLIPKVGDPRLVKNWRPISLLTVELKIVSKALAIRLMPAIASVLPQSQTAVPGKSIFSSLSIIRDIISLHSCSGDPLYILSLDQEKAFDRVHHGFLFHLLDVIKLPKLIVDSVKTLYTGFSCVIKNVTHLSRSFPYHRGIRQGDPTSSILYALALQPALNGISLALWKEGIPLPSGDRILFTAYADDVSIFLKNPYAIKTVTDTLAQISKFSNAALNLSKSEVLAINVAKKERSGLIPLDFAGSLSFDSIKILGTVFSPSLKIIPLQWNSKIMSSRYTLLSHLQSLQKMSFIQRAQWVKKKLWPKWSFLFKTLQPTGEQLHQLSSLMAEAIWVGGKHWLSENDLALPRSIGGLEVISPRDRVDVWRIGMLSKLLTMDTHSHLFQLAEMILNMYAGLGLGFRILYSRPDKMELGTLPAVYRAAFLAWDKLPTCVFPRCKEEILSFPAPFSKFLLQLEEPVEISCALAKSLKIRTISDLCEFQPCLTRLTTKLVSRTIDAVDSWEPPRWPDGVEEPPIQNMALPFNRKQSPFFLLYEDRIVSLDKWSNATLARILKMNLEPSKELNVPSKTWKILSSVRAPPSFINQHWKFLWRCVPTPSFYFHIGLRDSFDCVLCKSSDVSYDHQYRSCPVLQSIIELLNYFATNLDLVPLADQFHLYSEPSLSHRLANFLILSFTYTVALANRTVANYDTPMGKENFAKIYSAVVTRHLLYHAAAFPPSIQELRFNWDIYTYKGLIAYFVEDKLFLLDQQAFRLYDENTLSLV